MRKPQDYSTEERADLLAALLENQGFILLQSIKLAQYGPVSRRVLMGQCKDMTEYVKDTAWILAFNMDEEIIQRAVGKHPHGDGSEKSTIIGGDSVNP